MFSSKTFMVVTPMFSSLIHFELIFAYGVNLGSNLILLHMDIQFSLQCLLKSPFSPLNGWYSCQKSVVDIRGFISGLSVLFHWSICLYFSTVFFLVVVAL